MIFFQYKKQQKNWTQKPWILCFHIFHVNRLVEDEEEDGVTAAMVAAVYIINSVLNLKRKVEVG